MADATTIATAALRVLGVQEEVQFAVAPPVPNMTYVRRRSTSLAVAPESYSSEEIRSDRMLEDMRLGIRRITGDIVQELSPGSSSMFHEALLGGVWLAPPSVLNMGTTNITMAAIGVGYTGTATRGSGSFVTDGFKVGMRLKITGSGNATYDNRRFTIVSMSATVLTLGEERGFTFVAATLAAGSLTALGNYVEMGNAYRSFMTEDAYTDVGKFQRFNGVRFNSAQFQLPATGIALVTWGCIGQVASDLLSAPFDGSTALVVAGSTLGIPTFTSATRRISVATGSWVTAGFAIGDRVIFTGLASTSIAQNMNKVFTIVGITTTTNTNDTLIVAETMVNGADSGTGYTVTRRPSPAWLAAATNPVVASASGAIYIDGVMIGIVTDLSANISNNMANEAVVGSNLPTPSVWGNVAPITGSGTILLDSNLDVYSRFINETESAMIIRLDGPNADKFIQFYFPRIKYSSASIGDAATAGLPIPFEFTALKPSTPGTGVSGSAVVIFEAA